MQTIFILALLGALVSGSVVTRHNLQIFFNSTYDVNNDGKASLEEFVNYFRIMQPEADFKNTDIQQTFNVFDSNNDKNVTLEQLVTIAQIKIGSPLGHKQIHISFTNNHNEMQVMWVSNPECYPQPVVHFGTFVGNLSQKAYAVIKRYNVGHVGFHGCIYKAVLVGLRPNKRYYYKVGDETTQTFSQIKHFKAPPVKGEQLQQINIAVFGDMGTFAPFGFMVINQIARNNLRKSFDFVFLTGDIAYAGISSQSKGEIQPIWDLFGELSQSFAAYSPFMVGVGNHQKYYNYSAYTARYELPRKYAEQPNLWFSFDYGQLHIAYFSSEHPFGQGSEQYAFLQNDFRNARNNGFTKWIILGAHRPFYSSNQREFTNQSALVRDLEELINKYKIDIVQNGHIHSYQRSWPIYKGKAEKQGHTETLFKNPSHPIYVVQATAGAMLYQKWVDPAPEYALKRMLKYGYGRVSIKKNTLTYQFIQAPTGRVVDQWAIVKDN